MSPVTLHITSGDIAGSILERSGIDGDILVWHDILYDGPRNPGWPDNATLEARAEFIEHETAKGLEKKYILDTLKNQYQKIRTADRYQSIVLWFDACLFDQAMLVHILTCLNHCRMSNINLLCVDAFPGIIPFNGLGQLSPVEMASLFDQRVPVRTEQFEYAAMLDAAFACQDMACFKEISHSNDVPLPWIPKAVQRWLEEQPDSDTGLGKLETLALDAVENGCQTPKDIFLAVAAADTPPQYWGDSMLWTKINRLADLSPPLVTISGPAPRLPQYTSDIDLNLFKIERIHHGI